MTAFSRTNAIRFGAVLTGAAAVAGAATLMFSSGSHPAASAPRAVAQGHQASFDDVTEDLQPLGGFVTCTASIDSDQKGLAATSDKFRPGTKVEVLNPDNHKAVVVTIVSKDRDSGSCAAMSASAFFEIQSGQKSIDEALVRPVA